jgi:hypothetical protein
MSRHDKQLPPSSAFFSQGSSQHLPSPGLRRKRFSLQEGYTVATGGPAARNSSGFVLPDANMLLGWRHDPSAMLPDNPHLDAAQRRASCSLLPQCMQVDGLPSKALLARRRTSAPNNARRSDGLTGMSQELALDTQRFLTSSSDYPEGQYDWLAPNMTPPAPVTGGIHSSRIADASPRKSPRISYDSTIHGTPTTRRQQRRLCAVLHAISPCMAAAPARLAERSTNFVSRRLCQG